MFIRTLVGEGFVCPEDCRKDKGIFSEKNLLVEI
jgi:hypothetical protein